MNSENPTSCYLTNDYLDFRKDLLSSNEPVRYLLCGSFFEMPFLYILSNPTDGDVMFCDMTLCAIFNHVNVPPSRERNALIIDTMDCRLGYVRLRNGAEYLRKPYNFDNGPARTKNIKIRNAFPKSLLEKISTRWRNICMLTKDFVYAISCPLWPPDAYEWITRKRLKGWPSKNIIEAIVKGGCHLVSKPHGKTPNDDTQWRYSFSQGETILIHNTWTDVQKYIYHLLRIIKADIVRKCGGKDTTFISNYYFKTLMLWACEKKSAEFWEENNIMTSVRELLLDLIEKVIERNVPHYFMPVNNLMDDRPCDADIENEIRSLLSYGDEAIFEIMRTEAKAYKMTPYLLIISNEILYPLITITSQRSFNIGLIRDGCIRESDMLYNWGKSKSCFYPELKYLHRGVMIHLQLSKLNAIDNHNRKHRDDLIRQADELFDLSILKLDYGFTRIPFHLGWSIFELFQKVCLSCREKRIQYTCINLTPYSCSDSPGTISTCCYIRDRDDYIRNICLVSLKRIETRIFSLLQEMLLVGVTTPINPTYFVCSAYRANFFFNALCDYRTAFDLCKEVRKVSSRSSFQHINALPDAFLPFPLRNEWCGLYDAYIQIIFGFLTLYRTLRPSPMVRKRTIPVYICPYQYLKYIYTRCCKILNEPVTDFALGYGRLYHYKHSILSYRWSFSFAILQTALYIS